MISPLQRARLLGGVLVVAAFLSGMLVDRVLTRPGDEPTRLIMVATDVLPLELTRLGLEPEQEAPLRAALGDGANRMMRVLDEFDPRIRAEVDSTDRVIRSLLTPAQRVSFDSARMVNGSPFKRKLRGRPATE